jgi:hypothetical protein
MTTAQITQDFLRKSYSQLFGTHYPDILYVQLDRPHNYNLFLKFIALGILLLVIPILSVIPIYPLLYILVMYDFDGAQAFSSGVGSMNIWWLLILYIYYIFGIQYFGSTGFYSYIGIFMGLTPIFLILSWYYAVPVSIHDVFAGTYNSIMKTQPFMQNGIGFSTMRCAGDTNSRLLEFVGQDGVAGGFTDVFGIGFSGITIVMLVCLILISGFFVYWSSLTIQNHQLKRREDINVRIHSTHNAT